MIDWLASVQAIEECLKANGDDGKIAKELQLLQRDVTSWPTARPDGGITAPALSESLNHQALVEYAVNLHKLPEDAERNRQVRGRAFPPPIVRGWCGV